MPMLESTVEALDVQRTVRHLIYSFAVTITALIGGVTYYNTDGHRFHVQGNNATKSFHDFLTNKADEDIQTEDAALKAAYELPSSEIRAKLVSEHALRLANAHKAKKDILDNSDTFPRSTNVNTTHHITRIPVLPSNKCECECCKKNRIRRVDTADSGE